ncbi:methyltransferase domain-containing protein [Trichocoleus sp. FACHB-69]|nr:methyltransferase domain-containing protein [Trichocoleus sp. FACHB-69]
MTEWYKEDLAFIHDVGFSEYALKSAPGILEILERSNIREGLVVDLGCGTGLWAQELEKAHYRVLGVDISDSAIAPAPEETPKANASGKATIAAVKPPNRSPRRFRK